MQATKKKKKKKEGTPIPSLSYAKKRGNAHSVSILCKKQSYVMEAKKEGTPIPSLSYVRKKNIKKRERPFRLYLT